jgi:hypothetical protein
MPYTMYLATTPQATLPSKEAGPKPCPRPGNWRHRAGPDWDELGRPGLAGADGPGPGSSAAKAGGLGLAGWTCGVVRGSAWNVRELCVGAGLECQTLILVSKNCNKTSIKNTL